ncbi:hypothetical protein CDL62_13800 [Alkalitalea saponilacus]|nr:hypothetical protein CDL62_13800 [Alkalitalea saponilacus]
MTMQSNKIVLIIILTALQPLNSIIVSQSIHFNQAFSSHLTLNPANTGRFDGDWRAVAMYRHQGHEMSSDYNTSYFSFEYPVYINSEKIETGIYYSRDNSSGFSFPADRINLSISNGIHLNINSVLYAGIQLAWVHKQVDWSNTTFPDQYSRDTGGFDPSLPTSAHLENESTNYPDAGIGILYHRNTELGIFNIGYSLQQINRPQESFFGETFQLPVKHIWHSKADINLSADYFVIPTIVYLRMGKNQVSLTGIHFGYNLDEWMNQNNSIIAGVHFRNASMANARSVIFSGGMTWQFWTFMLSYDTSISRQNTARLNSTGLEFGIAFKLPSTQLSNKMIPWERF